MKYKLLVLSLVLVSGFAKSSPSEMLNHLEQAGVFKQAKAILLGKFTAGDENTMYALQEFANKINIPVYYSDYFGHGEHNYPLPFGFLANVSLSSDSTHELKISYDFS